eukprot:GHRQ01034963.1.p1 GENE.GHRQ01034963.1~~GHRQ01034963.1.p1  ORF type:complete len:124 (+),score=24.11 GHRQ01034963.1:359-730(+)
MVVAGLAVRVHQQLPGRHVAGLQVWPLIGATAGVLILVLGDARRKEGKRRGIVAGRKDGQQGMMCWGGTNCCESCSLAAATRELLLTHGQQLMLPQRGHAACRIMCAKNNNTKDSIAALLTLI